MLILLWIDFRLLVSLPQSDPSTCPEVPLHWPHKHPEPRCPLFVEVTSTEVPGFMLRYQPSLDTEIDSLLFSLNMSLSLALIQRYYPLDI